MKIVRDPEEMQSLAGSWRGQGLRIGFVPTMGYLHRGHTSLMEQARPLCERLVVSIFVNPLQFNEASDLDSYPRDLEGDAAKCEAAGVDILFIPEGFYPEGFSTRVVVRGLTERLEGAYRPGHFDGVTTVVARLFGLIQPSVTVFGEKDYQQLAVVRKMSRDLGLPLEVLGGTLIRDPDGLAMSSRNVRLSPEQRARALSLHRALFAMREHGSSEVAELLEVGRALLDVDALDYLEVVDAETLQPLSRVDRPARAVVAGHLGRTRLIDNVGLEPRG
ncbi:MAG: pantoate--beta-alanine ligase [Alphaproteobacteria bacterium]|nr:pantoate--beta-alanine ligase [Alphaproteobacteria bacterium]